jgi:hypothetical protein
LKNCSALLFDVYCDLLVGGGNHILGPSSASPAHSPELDIEWTSQYMN